MAITPDTKDWTWVLERVCPECNFDVRTFPREQVGTMIRDNAVIWVSLLGDQRATRRPSEDVWSALEYGCHVRDVYELYERRLGLMLTEDGPSYPDWNQDETALAGDYQKQEPGRVAVELQEAATRLSNLFDTVNEEQWERTGERSDGASFTIETFARYLIHDPMHHVRDVELGYSRLA